MKWLSSLYWKQAAAPEATGMEDELGLELMVTTTEILALLKSVPKLLLTSEVVMGSFVEKALFLSLLCLYCNHC